MNPNILFTQVTAGAASAYIMQLLQRWKKIPWITEHSHGVVVLVRVIMSAAVTLGISWTWSPAANNGHVLAIAIPSLAGIVHGAWNWFGQYSLQHGWSQLLSVGTVKSIQEPVEVKQP